MTLKSTKFSNRFTYKKLKKLQLPFILTNVKKINLKYLSNIITSPVIAKASLYKLKLLYKLRFQTLYNLKKKTLEYLLLKDDSIKYPINYNFFDIFKILELKLDLILIRSLLLPNIKISDLYISHKKILINLKLGLLKSICRLNDVISFKLTIKQLHLLQDYFKFSNKFLRNYFIKGCLYKSTLYSNFLLINFKKFKVKIQKPISTYNFLIHNFLY